jgi:hypothetical protein
MNRFQKKMARLGLMFVCGACVAANRPALTSTFVGGDAVRLNWPDAASGWAVQVSTNLMNNWTDIPGSSNAVALDLPLDSAVNSTFFRLGYVQSAASVYVNITNAPYGAVPDDGVDDSAAFQRALNEIKTNGWGYIYIPDGDYVFSNQVAVALISWNLTIQGASTNGVRLYAENTNGIFKFTQNQRTPTITLRDLTLIAGRDGAGTAIEITSPPGGLQEKRILVAENIVMSYKPATSNYFNRGLVATGIYRTLIMNSRFSAPVDPSDMTDTSQSFKPVLGFDVSGSHSPVLQNCSVTGASTAFNWNAIANITVTNYVAAEDGAYRNCSADYCKTGFRYEIANPYFPLQGAPTFWMTDCTVRSRDCGVLLGGRRIFQVTGNTFEQLSPAYGVRDIVFTNGTIHGLILHNTFSGGYSGGRININVDAAGYDLIFGDNVFSGPTNSVIAIDPAAANVFVYPVGGPVLPPLPAPDFVRPAAAVTVEVTTFGAVPNDGLDDSGAFTDALGNLIAQGGGTLRVPGGRYRFASCVTGDLQNVSVTIHGGGRGVSEIYGVSSNGLFRFDNTGSSNQLTISDISFLPLIKNAGTAITVNNPDLCADTNLCNLLMKEVLFETDETREDDYFVGGVDAAYLQNPVFDDVLFVRDAGDTNKIISAFGFRLNHANNPYFRNGYSKHAIIGYELTNTTGAVVFDRVNAVGPNIGFQISALTGGTCSVDMRGVHSNCLDQGVDVNGAVGVRIVNWASYQPGESTNYTDFTVNNCTNVFIEGNVFWLANAPDHTLIALRGTTSDVLIQHNIFNSSGATVLAQDAGVTGVTLTNNADNTH